MPYATLAWPNRKFTAQKARFLLQIHQSHFVFFWFKESNLEIIFFSKLKFFPQFYIRTKSGIMHKPGYAFLDGDQGSVFIVFDDYTAYDIAPRKLAFEFRPGVFIERFDGERYFAVFYFYYLGFYLFSHLKHSPWIFHQAPIKFGNVHS